MGMFDGVDLKRWKDGIGRFFLGIHLCTPLAGMCTKFVQNIPNPKFWPQISVFPIQEPSP